MHSEAEITTYLAQNFPGIAIASAPGGSFFFYDPDGNAEANQRFPFVTITIADDYDTASNLKRPGIFRLNIGVSKDTYRSLFGPPPSGLGPNGLFETGHDFTALDVLMPHPIYAPQSWVCVLNPDEATLDKVKELLTEAYEMALKKHAKKSAT